MESMNLAWLLRGMESVKLKPSLSTYRALLAVKDGDGHPVAALWHELGLEVDPAGHSSTPSALKRPLSTPVCLLWAILSPP